MIRDDWEEFRQVWKGAFKVYGKEPDDFSMEMVFAALKRFELAEIKRALVAHLNNPDEGRFVPKPADVVRGIEGDTGGRALGAWSNVQDGIRRAGAYGSVVFDDPITMRVIDDMGGWIGLCHASSDEEPFKRAEFERRYRAYAPRPPTEYPSKLLGIIECENGEKYAHRTESPYLIGNPERAMLVYQSGVSSVQRITSMSDMVKRLEQGALCGKTRNTNEQNENTKSCDGEQISLSSRT